MFQIVKVEISVKESEYGFSTDELSEIYNAIQAIAERHNKTLEIDFPLVEG